MVKKGAKKVKAESYIKVTKALAKNKKLSAAVVLINKAATLIIYVFYIAFLGFLALSKDPILLKILLVPASSFVVLSIARYCINAPRPYEKIERLTPLYNKKTLGKSFPSRHTFSGFIIGTVAIFFSVPLGVAVLIISTLLAVSRVLCGVHFVRDVIVGAAVGIGFGLIGMLLF